MFWCSPISCWKFSSVCHTCLTLSTSEIILLLWNCSRQSIHTFYYSWHCFCFCCCCCCCCTWIQTRTQIQMMKTSPKKIDFRSWASFHLSETSPCSRQGIADLLGPLFLLVEPCMNCTWMWSQAPNLQTYLPILMGCSSLLVLNSISNPQCFVED